MKDYIYLDYAAATPMDQRVIDSMSSFLSADFFNPSANYSPAKKVKQELNEARRGIANWLGAKSDEIIFTAGGTESNNLAIHGIMNGYKGKNVISSSIEHDSVIQPVSQYIYKIAPVDNKAIIDTDKLIGLIDNNTVLISAMYANNEVGSIQPIKSISQKIHEIRKQRLLSGNTTPLYLHVDASQAVNYLDLHHARLGIDLMSLNGGKIYGPKQTGVLFVKSGIILKSNILGGGQERNIRSGTENVAGAIGLSKALEIAQSTRKDEVSRLAELQSLFMKKITNLLPETIINGSLKNRLPNNIHLSFPGIDNERLLSILDDRKLYCAAGSACSASSNEPSHVLKAMGISDELARSSIRISLGRQTTKSDIEKSVDLIVGAIKEIS